MAAQLGVGFGGYLRFPYPVIQNSSRWLKGEGDWDHGAFTGAGNGGLGAWGLGGLKGLVLFWLAFFSFPLQKSWDPPPSFHLFILKITINPSK